MTPRLIPTFLTTLAVLAGTSPSLAADVSAILPIPRVEAGGHTSYIKKLAVDRAGKLVLTVSDDKTARLWQASSGRLLRVLRVPIREGHEGQLYAGALSADGRVAAVAGYTGFFERGQSSVYFFDTTTGILALRLTDLSDAAIDNLAFSDDGRFLAVCLADGRGVQIFDLQRQALIARHDELHDKIIGADFSSGGDLVVTTLDGKVWGLRDEDRFGKALMRPTAGKVPMHVQFAPDDRELVVGYDGEPGFSILDPKTLDQKYGFTLPVDLKQRGLHVAEWSSDGQYIYAGGETIAGFDAPIYRFGQRGRGGLERVLTSSRRISDIRRLPGGAMAFSSNEPEVGVFEANLRVRWRNRTQTMDLRRMAADFRLSRTGNAVAFGAAGGAGMFVFDVLAPADSALTRASSAPPGVNAIGRDAAGWQVDTRNDGELLSINGIDVALEYRESVRNWAAVPRAATLVVGTSWSLRMFDRAGKQKWVTPLSAEVNVTAVSEDGLNVVVALSDGTIRWYRVADGREILALFANRNGQDWIAWIPAGYYMSSISGDNFIGWHVNRGADRDPDFYRAIQFERILFRPDLVQAYFRSRGESAVIVAAGAADSFDIARLDSIAPPRLTIAATAKPQSDGRTLTQVSIKGASPGAAMQDWSLFVNGIPVTASQALGESERQEFVRDVVLPLSGSENQLRVESSNGRALGVAETYVEGASGVEAEQGSLYVVAVGASQFADPGIRDLNYAANDAAQMVQLFEHASLRKRFRSVKTLLLADTAPQLPTRANIVASMGGFLAAARGEDTVIVFLASHGISDKLGNYYFVPADARFSDIRNVQSGVAAATSLLRWDVFVDRLRHTAGRRLLIVDTCSSGAMGGTFDVHSLAKRSMSSSFALMAASRGNEESQEYAKARHGLFTHALMDAIESGFDPNADGTVSLSEAFEYAFDKVQELRNRAVGTQTPQLAAPEFLANMPIGVATTTANDSQPRHPRVAVVIPAKAGTQAPGFPLSRE